MGLLAYAEAIALLAEKERGEGWLAWCVREGVYQLPTAEWADALAAALRPLGARRPVEIGAGGGRIGRALRERGVALRLTDPGGAGEVERLDAAAALAALGPDLVLTCWLPHDSGAEARILAHPGVRWYLAVVQAGPGYAGGEALWRAEGWTAEPLAEVDRWSVSRADYLSGVDRGEHVRHGRAFLFRRAAGGGPTEDDA